MYRTADMVASSPYVIRYLAHKHGWKRPAEKVPHLLTAVQNGRIAASDFRGLDFSGIKINNKKRSK